MDKREDIRNAIGLIEDLVNESSITEVATTLVENDDRGISLSYSKDERSEVMIDTLLDNTTRPINIGDLKRMVTIVESLLEVE